MEAAQKVGVTLGHLDDLRNGAEQSKSLWFLCMCLKCTRRAAWQLDFCVGCFVSPMADLGHGTLNDLTYTAELL